MQAHYRNAIGYALPDEPDGNGLLPATADPARGTRLPNTLRAVKTGKLIVQTITSHFMKERPKFDGIGDAEYLGYIRNADVVLTDIYPFAHGCVERGHLAVDGLRRDGRAEGARPRKGSRRMDRDRADRGLLRLDPGHAR